MQKSGLGKNLGRLKNKLSITSSARKMRQLEAERDLINAESALGRGLFGQVAPGHQREFFCLQKNVWLWYEDGQTIRYEVRKDGVYKKVDDGNYRKIDGVELSHFRDATKAYLELVKANIYKG